jgi:hypothetical protein
LCHRQQIKKTVDVSEPTQLWWHLVFVDICKNSLPTGKGFPKYMATREKPSSQGHGFTDPNAIPLLHSMMPPNYSPQLMHFYAEVTPISFSKV